MGDVTGVMFYYYFVCKRKLWLYQNQISMEENSQDVSIGKHIDKTSYSTARKNILINDEISIDFIKTDGTIHEVKKSRKIEKASIWQVKYYLYYLDKLGATDLKAKIDYPLLKKVEEVNLMDEDKSDLEDIIYEIQEIVSKDVWPEAIISRKCDKCAYHDICFI